MNGSFSVQLIAVNFNSTKAKKRERGVRVKGISDTSLMLAEPTASLLLHSFIIRICLLEAQS